MEDHPVVYGWESLKLDPDSGGGKEAKDSGIQIGIMTRREDAMNEENFRKMSNGRMMWFGDERDHFKTLNQLIDTGSLCKVMEKPEEVSTTLQ